MRRLFLSCLIVVFTTLPLTSHSLEFSPSLELGLGLQHIEHSNGNSDNYGYAALKSYLFQEPGKILGCKVIGLGLGVNTHGDSQIILSPFSVTMFSILTVSPDYGLGIGNSPNYFGLSIGIGF
jgi:hypothetical protein